MSSGAYLIELPLAILGAGLVAVGALGKVAGQAALATGKAVGAVGKAAGQAMGDAGDAALAGADAGFLTAADLHRQRLETEGQIANLDAEFARAKEAAQAVLADITQFRQSLKTMNFHYDAETMTFKSLEEGESTAATASVNLSDLMFMDVDVQTRQITYVVLDYSEAISLQSARNSAQFKKLALASDLMKMIMVWIVDDPRDQEKLNQLVGVVNEMLDDNSVSYSHFRQFVQLRFAEFRHLQASLDVDMELWDQYCALCAMHGERPKRMGGEALEKEIQRLMEISAADKYVAAARRAFRETVLELGMQIRSDHVLDQVPGVLLVDRENPGYNMFVSEHDVSFMLEMVDTGEAPAEQRAAQHANMCKKRRLIEQRMREKGYRLRLCATDDSSCITASAVEEKKDTRQSNAEQLRRRRALAGKQAKLKVAGGR